MNQESHETVRRRMRRYLRRTIRQCEQLRNDVEWWNNNRLMRRRTGKTTFSGSQSMGVASMLQAVEADRPISPQDDAALTAYTDECRRML